MKDEGFTPCRPAEKKHSMGEWGRGGYYYVLIALLAFAYSPGTEQSPDSQLISVEGTPSSHFILWQSKELIPANCFPCAFDFPFAKFWINLVYVKSKEGDSPDCSQSKHRSSWVNSPLTAHDDWGPFAKAFWGKPTKGITGDGAECINRGVMVPSTGIAGSAAYQNWLALAELQVISRLEQSWGSWRSRISFICKGVLGTPCCI